MSGDRPPGIPPDGHPGDLLSAHLDGELDAELSRWVVGHLDGCAECRQAADDVARARALVRDLPSVVPTPVVERIVARRHALVRRGGVFVAAAAIVLSASALSSAVRHRTVVPAVDEMVARHDAGHRSPLNGMEETDSAGRIYTAPAALARDDVRLSRQSVYDGPDVLAVVYDNEGPGSAVSVFEQPGRVEWDELPAGGRASIGDRAVWRRSGTPTVIVAEVGHLVVTVVADDEEVAEAVVEALPSIERRSTWDRLHDACQRVTEVFALGG